MVNKRYKNGTISCSTSAASIVVARGSGTLAIDCKSPNILHRFSYILRLADVSIQCLFFGIDLFFALVITSNQWHYVVIDQTLTI